MPAGLVLAAAAAALAVGGSAKVDAALLAGLAPVEATLNVHGQVHRCSGPALAEVLGKLGLPAAETLRGAALQRGIVVHARDGYAVLFSLGELDPATGAEPAIIATQCDGKPIGPEEGPYRLVLPGDKRPARSVRQVESIELR
jgi:hypothetical protein